MSLTALIPMLGPVLELVERIVPDPKDRLELEARLADYAQESEARIVEARAQVVSAEAQGSWLQRAWRPIFMFVCMGLLGWHAIALPILAVSLGVSLNEMIGLTLVPDGLWTLLTIGMGGYIAGRSGEKIATVLKAR